MHGITEHAVLPDVRYNRKTEETNKKRRHEWWETEIHTRYRLKTVNTKTVGTLRCQGYLILSIVSGDGSKCRQKYRKVSGVGGGGGGGGGWKEKHENNTQENTAVSKVDISLTEGDHDVRVKKKKKRKKTSTRIPRRTILKVSENYRLTVEILSMLSTKFN